MVLKLDWKCGPLKMRSGLWQVCKHISRCHTMQAHSPNLNHDHKIISLVECHIRSFYVYSTGWEVPVSFFFTPSNLHLSDSGAGNTLLKGPQQMLPSMLQMTPQKPNHHSLGLLQYSGLRATPGVRSNPIQPLSSTTDWFCSPGQTVLRQLPDPH